MTEEGGLLRTFPRRRIDETDVDLHILAEPTGAKGDDLGAQAIENIGRLFLEDRLSLTGGVMRALRTTHATLLDWNRRSIPREQVTTGITAALVHGTLLYLFQAGPSLCFRGRNGRLERLLPIDGEDPLGEGELEPCLRRIEMVPGDLVIAASESLLEVVDIRRLEDLLAGGAEDALPELYLLTRELPTFALMAITCIDSDESSPPQDTIVAEEPVDDPTANEPIMITDLPSSQRQSLPTAVEDPVAREAPDFFADRAQAPEPEESRLVTPPPVDISKTVVRLRSDQGSRRGDYARTTGVRRGFGLDISQGRILAIGGAVAIVLFVGAFAVPDLLRENRQEKIAGLLQQAQTQLAAAGNEQDPTLRRDLLDDVNTLTAEILRYDREQPDAIQLRQQAQGALGQLNAVFDLGPMTTVTTISRQVTGEVSLDSMVVAGGNAFLLDSKGGRILSVPLNASTQPATIFAEGQTYRGTPAKKPTFFTWEGTDQDGRLLVLDAERKLFAIRPGSLPEPLPLRRTNTWSSVAGIAAYDSNLYVLDPTGNKVHRYLTAASGFDSEPESILSGQVDLKDAVSLEVDGDIYILKRTGSVLRFSQGVAADFKLGGIDRGLTGPNAMEVVSPTSEVFISDAGNKRVVVAGKDGVFKRQLTSNVFTDIRALSIDPFGGQLYAVVGDALLTAPLVR
ncbi:MAG: hypothetical protein AB7P33_10130 [Dehalococcoidia bacterium]